jgi:sigma-B regulation protein RsbU (phosphoserine phosphatase)
MSEVQTSHDFFGASDLTAPRAGEHLLQAELRLIVESVYGPPVHRLPGLDVGRAYWGATKEFRYGGDMVDVFQYGSGFTSFAVVDISGHGIGAARHAGLVKYALRAYASAGLGALDSVRALNRLCIENSEFEGDDEFFATVFFGIVDRPRKTLHYVSAGHDAAFILMAHGYRALTATGPIIGLMDDDAAFVQAVVPLADGDIFAAVTDGFTEARNVRKEFLGSLALLDVIERDRTLDAENQAQAITTLALAYAGSSLEDDVAALVVKVVRD